MRMVKKIGAILMGRKAEPTLEELRKGFTLVELSLAIAFIAVLSIIMTLIITNSISAYHRGITLNTVNTVGMDLVDNMREAVQNSSGKAVVDECEMLYSESGAATALSACQANKGMSFVSVEKYATVNGLGSAPVPAYGAFCTGDYSYIWNSGYFFNERKNAMLAATGMATLTYRDAGGSTSSRSGFRLLRVADVHRAVCKVAAGVVGGNYLADNLGLGGGISGGNNFNGGFDLTSCEDGLSEVCDMISEEPVELLEDGETSLALYDLAVATAADNGDADIMFYAVSFILGTIQGGINITSDNNYCVAPEEYNESVEGNFDYCAINKFNFAAQATGGQKQ